MNKKKIVLIIDQIATGGAEKLLISYYYYLLKNGYEVGVFSLYGPNNSFKKDNNFRVEYAFKKNRNNIFLKSLQQLLLLIKFYKYLNKNRPTVIFSFLDRSNIITVLVPFKSKKVLSVHNVISIQYKKINNFIIRKSLYHIIKCVYNFGDNIIVAVSNQVKIDLVNSFSINENKISVINNFVDRPIIEKLSHESIEDFHFKNGIKYILNIGRFTTQKGQWKLIKAFGLFKNGKNFQDVKLIIIGEGELYIELVKLVTELKLNDEIFILPFKENPYKYMYSSHLFVLSSLYEGFPIVISEISSLRIPFIGSRNSIPCEMFSDMEVWRSLTFESSIQNNVLNNTKNEDEVKLSKLLTKIFEEVEFRLSSLTYSEIWEEKNNIINQFQYYTNLFK